MSSHPLECVLEFWGINGVVVTLIIKINIEVRGRISLKYIKNSKRGGEGGVGDKSIWYLDYLGYVVSQLEVK